MSTDIYQEIIMDHVKHPRHNGSLANPTHTVHNHNVSCGDRIVIDVVIHEEKIENIAWNGHGCAISSASASVLSEMLLGMSLEDAKHITGEEIKKQLGLENLNPMREKCLQVPLKALSKLF